MIALRPFLTALLLLALPFSAALAAEAVTADDPAVSRDILALKLEPLTKDELAAEASAWQALLRGKAAAIAAAEIARRNGDAAADPASLQALRDEKAALLERFGLVLDAYEVKGGDPAEMRKYAAAVSGIRADVNDLGTTWQTLSGWLGSEEGGLKWLVRLCQFAGVMAVAAVLAAFAGKLVGKALERQPRLSGLLKRFLNTMSRRVILVVGLLVALGTVGVNVGAALALIGGGAFILAFALQDTLGNFASGLMLLLYRPFDVGDAVEIGGITGSVHGVSLVNTTVLTFDNKKVIVPNKKVWGEVITNITGMPTRRVDLTFGIGYGDDLAQAQAILERILAEHELVLDQPAPLVKVHELADSSVNFICRPWTRTGDYLTVLSDVTRRVKEEFDAAGISIPYPQRDIHLHPVPAAT